MKTIILYSIVIVLFCICSCKKYEPCPEQDLLMEFRAIDTSAVPYNGFDSLYFELSDSNGISDTVLFIGQGKKYFLSYIDPLGSNNYCYRESTWGESYSIDFLSSTNMDKISLIFREGRSFADVDIFYNNRKYPTNTCSLNDCTNIKTLIYSIYLNGRDYHHILKIYQYHEFNYLDSVYYRNYLLMNKQQGLLRLNLDSITYLTILD